MLQFDNADACSPFNRLARSSPATTRAPVLRHLGVCTHMLSCRPFTCSGATPRDYRILPEKIILVRHAESEGNVDNKAYTYIPDSQVPLVGLRQARQHT